MLCSIAEFHVLQAGPYFDEPVRRVKIQTTSKKSQRYYTTKRLLRDLLQHAKLYCPSRIHVFIFRNYNFNPINSSLARCEKTYLDSFWALFVLYEMQLENKQGFLSADNI